MESSKYPVIATTIAVVLFSIITGAADISFIFAFFIIMSVGSVTWIFANILVTKKSMIRNLEDELEVSDEKSKRISKLKK